MAVNNHGNENFIICMTICMALVSTLFGDTLLYRVRDREKQKYRNSQIGRERWGPRALVVTTAAALPLLVGLTSIEERKKLRTQGSWGNSTPPSQVCSLQVGGKAEAQPSNKNDRSPPKNV